MIGAIGAKSLDDVILFEVSDEKVLTLSDFTRKNNVRYSKNDVLLKKPREIYVGPDLDTIDFKIELKAYFGVNPQKVLDDLTYIHRDGTVVSLLIGTKAFGVNRWVIKSLNMVSNVIDNKGALISATVDISLGEYV